MPINTLARFVERLFYGMLPPDEPDRPSDPEYMRAYQHAVAKWRRGVVHFNWAILLSVALLVIVTFGVLIPVNWNRVAWEDDVGAIVHKEITAITTRMVTSEDELKNTKQALANLKRTTDMLMMSQMRVEIRETRRLQCYAIRDADLERKAIYARMLSELMEQYEEMRGRPYARTACEELI
jgi:hypothetical protein